MPRLTTVYDAATWRYRDSPTPSFPGPEPKNPVPVLCHQNHQRPIGVCRVCSVLTVKKGQRRRQAHARLPAPAGRRHGGPHRRLVEVRSSSPATRSQARPASTCPQTVKVLLELLAANYLHQDQADERPPLSQRAAGPAASASACRSSRTGGQLRPRQAPFKPPAVRRRARIDDSSAVIRVDHNNCILCDRCVRGCSEVKPFKIIGHTGFGNKARISFDLGQPMGESGCVCCGECAVSCPTGALTFKGIDLPEPRPVGRASPGQAGNGQGRGAGEARRCSPACPYAFLKWNEGAVGRVDCRAGQVLCKQGEYGSTAFIIEAGGWRWWSASQVVLDCPHART